MKIKLAAVALAVSSVFAAGAVAAPYVGIHGGVSSVGVGKINNGESGSGIDYENGAYRKGAGSFGAVLGYDFYEAGVPMHVELDHTYRNNVSKNSSKVRLVSFMANTAYDFVNETKFTPYVGVGLGYAHADVTNPGQEAEFDKDGKVTGSYEGNIRKGSGQFAYGAVAGVRYAVNNDVDIDLGYRYIDAGKFKVAGHAAGLKNEKVHVRTNDMVLGINFSF